ncbi:uncharacterized protein BJX67DRAFT_344723 [Aspergillus lucknowensis]|uniref:Uncharacterized protein n=1 Tax=Aspergillus lucknowensis TaxID=176173 RepID=A0ABR4M266_9EURO
MGSDYHSFDLTSPTSRALPEPLTSRTSLEHSAEASIVSQPMICPSQGRGLRSPRG